MKIKFLFLFSFSFAYSMNPPSEQETKEIFSLFTVAERKKIGKAFDTVNPWTEQGLPPFKFSNQIDATYITQKSRSISKKGNKITIPNDAVSIMYDPTTDNRVVILWHGKNHWQIYVNLLQQRWNSLLKESEL